MIPDPLLYGLAVLGAGVVLAVAAVLLYIVVLALPVLAERVLVWAAGIAFRAGGGRPHDHDDGDRWPDPPYDRIWVELRWLSRVARLLQKKVGIVNWVGNPAERPDMESFYESREEHLQGATDE